MEVVVAVLILGIAFGAIFEAFSRSLRNLDTLDAGEVALQYAQNKMNEILVDERIRQDGMAEGRWSENYWWDAQLESREIDDPTVKREDLSTKLLQVRLTVHYRHLDREKSVKLFCIKVVPKPKPKVDQPGNVNPLTGN